ncbi:MAG TPA: hypothetical protein PLI07_07395, partial [Candidatus Hydrogenedentes bacterium]|nr:hypothetical protein [Candidatus Hydrogenedentota bacterium]
WLLAVHSSGNGALSWLQVPAARTIRSRRKLNKKTRESIRTEAEPHRCRAVAAVPCLFGNVSRG